MASLEAALAVDGEQIPLRLHGARMYLEGGQAAKALGHAELVLAAQPAEVEALGLAATAAEALGQTQRAAGFQALVQALGGTPAARAPAPSGSAPPPPGRTESASTPPGPGASLDDGPSGPPPQPAGPVSLGTEADLDAFLNEVLGVDPDLERPAVTLADVGGLADVKRRLHTSFLGPMRNPELRRL